MGTKSAGPHERKPRRRRPTTARLRPRRPAGSRRARGRVRTSHRGHELTPRAARSRGARADAAGEGGAAQERKVFSMAQRRVPSPLPRAEAPTKSTAKAAHASLVQAPYSDRDRSPDVHRTCSRAALLASLPPLPPARRHAASHQTVPCARATVESRSQAARRRTGSRDGSRPSASAPSARVVRSWADRPPGRARFCLTPTAVQFGVAATARGPLDRPSGR